MDNTLIRRFGLSDKYLNVKFRTAEENNGVYFCGTKPWISVENHEKMWH